MELQRKQSARKKQRVSNQLRKIKTDLLNVEYTNYKFAYNAINTKEKPNYLSRSNNLSTGLYEPVKPKFTHSAKGKPC